MRKVSLAGLHGDEALAKTIFDGEGRILLREGVVLKPLYIQKLQTLGIAYAYIEDGISHGIEVDDVVSEQTRQESKKIVAETMHKYVKRGDLAVDGIFSTASRLIDEILSEKEVLISLTDIRTKEDTLFSHSVNVSILSVVTGLNLGYSVAKLKDLASGALLHDVGMAEVLKEKMPNSKQLQYDPDKYLEHPKLGYNLLNKQSAITSFTKVIALTHHERCDGSGFPFGLKGNEIHEMSRIVAVCDAFDSMINGSMMTSDIPAYQAIEYLSVSTHLFDRNIVQKFVSSISLYPSGCKVKLNTGEVCIVVRQNKGFPARPVTRVLAGGFAPVESEIDLSQHLTVFVAESYND